MSDMDSQNLNDFVDDEGVVQGSSTTKSGLPAGVFASGGLPTASGSADDDDGNDKNSGSQAGAGTEEPKIVTFDDTSTDTVFVQSSNAQYIGGVQQLYTFHTKNKSISLQGISWLASTGDDKYTEIDGIKYNAENSTKGYMGQLVYNNKEDSPSGSIQLYLTNFINGKKYIGDDMRLQVSWTSEFELNKESMEANGTTKSLLFSVISNQGDLSKVQGEIKKANEDSQEDREPDAKYTDSTNGSGVDGSGSNSGGDGTKNDKTSSTSTSDSDNSSGGGGGGLSTGAKAGIGAGCGVVGLLLIGFLLWWFLRRRRQAKNRDASLSGQQSSNAYMVDKETHGRGSDSPHSPYSDENQVQNLPMDDIDSPNAIGVARTSESSRGGRANNSGVQTPQGVSSNVAHLVEEGMTADEIRRLEEEERQLDDEIERAARR